MIAVSIMTSEQFEQTLRYMDQIEKIYLDADLFREFEQQKEHKFLKKIQEYHQRIYIKLPHIIRSSDIDFMAKTEELMRQFGIAGVLCPSIDAVGWIRQTGYPCKIIGDASLYTWNADAFSFLDTFCDGMTLPLELNSGEIKTLCRNVSQTDKLEAVVYGKIPLMVSAGCVKLTSGNCDHSRGSRFELEDRMHVKFPVYTNCNHCYNIIYNHLPLFIYDDLWMIKEDKIQYIRIDFTDESGSMILKILETFLDITSSKQWKKTKQKSLKIATTSGHFRRGVE